MLSISSISQNIISKKSAFNFVVSIGVGALGSRFYSIAVKKGIVVGALTGATTSLGQAIIGEEVRAFKKTVITLATLAVVLFGTMQYATSLREHFALALTPDMIAIIISFNLLGQAIMFVLSKTVLADPFRSIHSFDALTDEQVKTLHKQLTENPDRFKALSPIMQLFACRRFSAVNLKPHGPSRSIEAATIKHLSNHEIRILHKHGVIPNKERDVAHALMRRYFELGLKYRLGFERFLKDLPMPQLKSMDAFRRLEDAQIRWYEEFFFINPSEQDNVPINIQWELAEKTNGRTKVAYNVVDLAVAFPDFIYDNYTYFDGKELRKWVGYSYEIQKAFKTRFDELALPNSWSCHPQKPEEVDNLSKSVVEMYHEEFFETLLKPEVVLAFYRRFYQLRLPFPRKQTVASLIATESDLPKINIDLPTTLEGIANLDNNQLPWVYSSCQNEDLWESLPFSYQAALNKRFKKTLDCWKCFTPDRLTVEEIQQASKSSINKLHLQFKDSLVNWMQLPRAIQQALNARFTQLGKTALFTDLNAKGFFLPAALTELRAAFQKHPENWQSLWKAQQEDFNTAFKNSGLDEIAPTSWR